MFDPHKKKNQHYVPQFWQRRFADENGVLYGVNRTTYNNTEKHTIKAVSPKKIMSDDWIYTVFDESGIASNRLENEAGDYETKASQIMLLLDVPAYLGNIAEQKFLSWFVAFSALRHPGAMARGHSLSKQLAYAFADVHTKNIDDYCLDLARFGLPRGEAVSAYEKLRAYTEGQLLEMAEYIENLSPNDPVIPSQLAVYVETIDILCLMLSTLKITILDVPTDFSFILGDTPFPLDLGLGFNIPLSSRLSLLWEVGDGSRYPEWSRRLATINEVNISNKTQADNAAEMIIGSSQAVVKQYYWYTT